VTANICLLKTIENRQLYPSKFGGLATRSHLTPKHHPHHSADEGNDAAANILQHLATILSEERDKNLPAETRLLRMLLRTQKQEERLSMMLEKLLLANPPPRPKVKGEETGEEREEEPFWGAPEVCV
jgi:hypothetical protein